MREIIAHEAIHEVTSGRHSRREGAGLGWARDSFPEKVWHEQVPEDQGLQKGDKELQVHVDKVWKNMRGRGKGAGEGEQGEEGFQLLWKRPYPVWAPSPLTLPDPSPVLTSLGMSASRLAFPETGHSLPCGILGKKACSRGSSQCKGSEVQHPSACSNSKETGSQRAAGAGLIHVMLCIGLAHSRSLKGGRRMKGKREGQGDTCGGVDKPCPGFIMTIMLWTRNVASAVGSECRGGHEVHSLSRWVPCEAAKSWASGPG